MENVGQHIGVEQDCPSGLGSDHWHMSFLIQVNNTEILFVYIAAIESGIIVNANFNSSFSF